MGNMHRRGACVPEEQLYIGGGEENVNKRCGVNLDYGETATDCQPKKVLEARSGKEPSSRHCAVHWIALVTISRASSSRASRSVQPRHPPGPGARHRIYSLVILHELIANRVDSDGGVAAAPRSPRLAGADAAASVAIIETQAGMDVAVSVAIATARNGHHGVGWRPGRSSR